LRADILDHQWQRDQTRFREAPPQNRRTKKVVSVIVCDVDRGQPFAGRLDPVGELCSIADRYERVDYDRFMFAGDEHCGGRRPIPPTGRRARPRRSYDRSAWDGKDA
jgi:hypothetical protein